MNSTPHRKGASLLPPDEWYFDDVPNNELDACYDWEMAREFHGKRSINKFKIPTDLSWWRDPSYPVTPYKKLNNRQSMVDFGRKTIIGPTAPVEICPIKRLKRLIKEYEASKFNAVAPVVINWEDPKDASERLFDLFLQLSHKVGDVIPWGKTKRIVPLVIDWKYPNDMIKRFLEQVLQLRPKDVEIEEKRGASQGSATDKRNKLRYLAMLRISKHHPRWSVNKRIDEYQRQFPSLLRYRSNNGERLKDAEHYLVTTESRWGEAVKNAKNIIKELHNPPVWFLRFPGKLCPTGKSPGLDV